MVVAPQQRVQGQDRPPGADGAALQQLLGAQVAQHPEQVVVRQRGELHQHGETLPWRPGLGNGTGVRVTPKPVGQRIRFKDLTGTQALGFCGAPRPSPITEGATIVRGVLYTAYLST